MNAIATKLAEAGVKLPPQNKRVWQCVKDHPGVTALRVSQIIHSPQSGVSSLLTDLLQRGMVTRGTQEVRTKGPHGSTVKRKVWVYHAVGETFALVPKKTRLPPPKFKHVKAEPAPSGTVTPPPAAPVPRAVALVESLTIAQARELWAVLDRMFGSK